MDQIANRMRLEQTRQRNQELSSHGNPIMSSSTRSAHIGVFNDDIEEEKHEENQNSRANGRIPTMLSIVGEDGANLIGNAEDFEDQQVMRPAMQDIVGQINNVDNPRLSTSPNQSASTTKKKMTRKQKRDLGKESTMILTGQQQQLDIIGEVGAQLELSSNLPDSAMM